MDKTPASSYKRDSEHDNSCQISSTEEFSENVDVVWDWNSPQANQRPKKQQKRLLHSPKIPMKRHSSSHSIQDFQKLRAELQSLRDEIAIPENEESLLLSPLEEADYKCIDENEAAFNCYMQEHITESAEFSNDLFDDSFDEQLVQFSHKIENDLASKNLKISLHYLDNTQKNRGVNCDPTHVSDFNKFSSNKKFIFAKVNNDATKLVNDSFDELLGTIEDSMTACNENNLNSKNNVITSKVEFHRTKSFELSNLEHSKEIHANKLQEIERKRKNAFEKLQIKKKQKIPRYCPTQCSIEEIEQKRQQALAKREAKRQQEIIEQKRQEALRRLEMSRKKNATIARSSLTNRLNY